jgi:hypothetical protein
MKLKPGNIWSGDKQLAVFTNPTEIAKRKGNLRNSYPVTFDGKEFKDAEAAYQTCGKDLKAHVDRLESLMVAIITAKLIQHPQIQQALDDSGGSSWILQCRHEVNGNPRWEGQGLDSRFIRCLHAAYLRVNLIKEQV